MAIQMGWMSQILPGARVTVPDPDPDPDPPPGATPLSVGMAPGLYDRKNRPADTSSDPAWAGRYIRGNYVKGFVMDVYHKELEPDGPQIVAGNPIDNALAQTAGTHANGQPYTLGLKVRSHMGQMTALWARGLGGTPTLNYRGIQDATTHPMPRIYEPSFIDFHVDHKSRMAERYGSDERILDWALELAMNVYAEPFIQQTAKQDPTATAGPAGAKEFKEVMAQANRDWLMSTGYTRAKHLQAFQRLIEVQRLFPCASSLALNPAQMLDETKGGEPIKSLDWTFARAAEMSTHLGPRASLGNNSIREDKAWPNGLSQEYQRQYERIRDSKGPKYFQTANTTLIKTNGATLYGACVKACQYGAWMIELPGTVEQYTNTSSWGMTPAQFDEINGWCAQNVTDYP